MEHTTDENPQELVHFLTLCKDYCILIEHTPDYPKGDFVRRLYGFLPDLFRYLSQMPEGVLEDVETWLDSYAQVIADETVSYYEERVRELLGEEMDLFLYYPVGETQERELQPERLSRLLLLIYRELGIPLLILREDASELLVASLSALQYAFDTYMGDAMLSALRILHYYKDAETLADDIDSRV